MCANETIVSQRQAGNSCSLTLIARRSKMFLHIILLCNVLVAVAGQLVVLEPPDLATRFPDGQIEGSTAAFGTPYYGERIMGKVLFFDTTGCHDDDYDFKASRKSPHHEKGDDDKVTTSPMEDTSTQLSPDDVSEGHHDALRTVVMIRRGNCHFVTKVLVAEKKGATAAVIIDNEGSMSGAEDVKKVIMANDGWGDGVVIPSLLIGEVDGLQIINSLAKQQNVIVELVWSVPKATPVQMDQWLSPAFAETNRFLEQFAPYAKRLKHKLDYRPHYVVITLPGDFKEMCTDSSGRFCGWDPDKGGKTTGKHIMEETVRQLCLWEASQDVNITDFASGLYSEQWWSYVEAVNTECPHKGTSDQDRAASKSLGLTPSEYEELHTIGETCSFNLMKKIGVDVFEVKQCYKYNFDNLLTHELLNKAWSSTALMINNWQYSGPLDPEQVTRTLCTGFEEDEIECRDLFHPSRQELLADGLMMKRLDGFPLWAVVLISSICVIVGVMLSVALYWYCVHPRLRKHLRYAIMDEMKKRKTSVFDARQASNLNIGNELSISPSIDDYAHVELAIAQAAPVGKQFSCEDSGEKGESGMTAT